MIKKNIPGRVYSSEWRRWDLNPQPRDYDALALPLSYLAKRARYYYGALNLSTKIDPH